MNRGFLLFVQENADTDYLEQARLCAKSIKKFNNDPVCLMTDSKTDLTGYDEFDIIKSIPGEDLAQNSKWKIENRCKIYDVSPFKHTIVLDVDTLVLENLESYWQFFSNYTVFYLTTPTTYRNEAVKSNYYRQVFVANELPNIYCGIHYFARGKFSQQFYDQVKDVVQNYETYKKKFTPHNTQTWCSMDVATAIAVKVLNCEHMITSKNSPINFVHMKGKVQNWKGAFSNWLGQIDYFFNKNNELIVGNHLQKGIFHYVENKFINKNIKESFDA